MESKNGKATLEPQAKVLDSRMKHNLSNHSNTVVV